MIVETYQEINTVKIYRGISIGKQIVNGEVKYFAVNKLQYFDTIEEVERVIDKSIEELKNMDLKAK